MDEKIKTLNEQLATAEEERRRAIFSLNVQAAVAASDRVTSLERQINRRLRRLERQS